MSALGRRFRHLIWRRSGSFSHWATGQGAAGSDYISAGIAAIAIGWACYAAIGGHSHLPENPLALEPSQRDLALARRTEIADQVRYRGYESLTAAYGGSPYTYASDVTIKHNGTSLTAHAVDWEGRPFDHPIYYGARHARWPSASSIGGMIDFTHSKVYSPPEQRTKFSGVRDGMPVPSQSTIADQFHKLEFTHGHNMLTLNGLVRLPSATDFVSPYLGIGMGVSLPHTEVQLKGDSLRTYEYQYAGPAMQALIGIEIRMPRLTYFFEYKLTFASYRAPLHNRDGTWLFSDLWHQMQRWISGREPAGGWVTTRLLSHQVIGGIGIRSSPSRPIALP